MRKGEEEEREDRKGEIYRKRQLEIEINRENERRFKRKVRKRVCLWKREGERGREREGEREREDKKGKIMRKGQREREMKRESERR